jgi:hypothetical protein
MTTSPKVAVKPLFLTRFKHLQLLVPFLLYKLIFTGQAEWSILKPFQAKIRRLFREKNSGYVCRNAPQKSFISREFNYLSEIT